MQPVSAVRKYGTRVMEAIRTLKIPKESLQNLLTGGMGLNIPIPSFTLAGGGSVPSKSIKSDQSMGSTPETKRPINIMNVVDPTQMLQTALGTPEGQNAIYNFMSFNNGTIKRILT